AAALKGLYEAAGVPVPPQLPADARKADAGDDSLVALLVRVREGLGNPEPLQNHKALEASLKGALRALDPYCVLLDQDEFTRGHRGAGLGVGLEIEEPVLNGRARIRAVTVGGPAQQAGLRPGD